MLTARGRAVLQALLANAGINPNKIPVPIATTAVTIKTTRSTLTSARRGIVRFPYIASKVSRSRGRMSTAQINLRFYIGAPGVLAQINLRLYIGA